MRKPAHTVFVGEQELLIRIGLALNDLYLMQRLWGALYDRRPRTVLTREIQAVQQIALLLIIVGKLFDARHERRVHRWMTAPSIISSTHHI